MPKKFAYCIGGCRTVPEYLPDLTTDRADCFAVFFAAPGPSRTLFMPNSTTNTGRNAAFAEAAKGDYEYVVIMDDDVEFAGLSHADGFRKFEALLDEFRPAIAVPRYSWHLKGQNKYSELDLKKRVQGLGAADAIMNAIHRDVWNLFLPYWTGADHICWWDAQQVLHRIAAMLMPGAFVQFNELEVKNLTSGPYPRGNKDCAAGDAYIEEMTRPEWRAHITKYKHPTSFHEYAPVLRESYKLTRNEVGRYFDLEHEYWRGRCGT